MKRYILLLLMGLSCVALGLGMFAGGVGRAAPGGPLAPLVPLDCTFTTVNMNLTASLGSPAGRVYPNTAGDLYAQFPATSITTTVTSTTSLAVNETFNGVVGGTLSGSVSGDGLNGLLITDPEGFITTPRGLTVGRVQLVVASGTITAVLVLNDVATTSTPPYYPRTVQGYLASNDMSGSLAGQQLLVTLAGTETNFAGQIAFTGGGVGRLVSGASPLTENVLGTRGAPASRTVGLLANDRLTQFRSSPLVLASAANGRVQPVQELAGTWAGTFNGGILAGLNTVLAPTGGVTKGWQAGNMQFADTGGDLWTGVWVADLSGSDANYGVVGTVFEVAGTGAYSNTAIMGDLTGRFFSNQTLFLGGLGGTYCPAPLPPSPTASPVLTSTPPAASATTTPTGQATLPVLTVTVTPTGQATSAPSTTSTPVAATPTLTLTATPNPPSATLSPPPATATPCAISFLDVPMNNPFYPYVRCLACRGIISGYSDGTFRPNNNITRGQVCKMVTNAAGIVDPIPSAQQTFSDVPTGQPFWVYIERLAGRGYVSGYGDGTFRPSNPITRGQLAKIVANTAQYADPIPSGQQTFQDVLPSDPFWVFIERVAAHGAISGYGCNPASLNPCTGQLEACPGLYYRHCATATRGQTAKIVANVFYPGCQTP